MGQYTQGHGDRLHGAGRGNDFIGVDGDADAGVPLPTGDTQKRSIPPWVKFGSVWWGNF